MATPLEPLYASTDEDAAGSLALGMAADGDLRWAVTDVTRPLEQLRRRLDPSPVAAIALGRAAAAAALLLRFSTKYPGRLHLEVLGDGPLGKIQVQVDTEGRLRAIAGELRFPGVDDDPLSVGPAVGKGLLRITQESEHRDRPWVSQTGLVSGEIGEDLVHFLEQSLQIRSAALLTAKPGRSGVLAAGGLLVEALPGCREESLRKLEENIARVGDLGDLLREDGKTGLLARIMDGLDVEELEQHPLRYTCGCSRDVLLERLTGLPEEQLREVADHEGKAILECAFCLGQFVFSVDDLRVN